LEGEPPGEPKKQKPSPPREGERVRVRGLSKIKILSAKAVRIQTKPAYAGSWRASLWRAEKPPRPLIGGEGRGEGVIKDKDIVG
jgi:hypothetical protein